MRYADFEQAFAELNTLTWKRELLVRRVNAAAGAMGVVPEVALITLMGIVGEIKLLEQSQEVLAQTLLRPIEPDPEEGFEIEDGRLIEASYTDFNDAGPGWRSVLGETIQTYTDEQWRKIREQYRPPLPPPPSQGVWVRIVSTLRRLLGLKP